VCHGPNKSINQSQLKTHNKLATVKRDAYAQNDVSQNQQLFDALRTVTIYEWMNLYFTNKHDSKTDRENSLQDSR